MSALGLIRWRLRSWAIRRAVRGQVILWPIDGWVKLMHADHKGRLRTLDDWGEA